MSDLVKSERREPKMRKQVVGAYVEPNIPFKKIQNGNTFLIVMIMKKGVDQLSYKRHYNPWFVFFLPTF